MRQFPFVLWVLGWGVWPGVEDILRTAVGLPVTAFTGGTAAVYLAVWVIVGALAYDRTPRKGGREG